MIAQLFLDTETIPAQRPDVLEELRQAEAESLGAALAAVKPPGNYKKQETIDEWNATEAPKVKQALIDASTANVEAAYRKTGLDGSFGQIVCVSFAYCQAKPVTVFCEDWQAPDAESTLLQTLNGRLSATINPNMYHVCQVVAHNAQFDVRFLTQRSIVRGVRPHPVIARAAQAKPWEVERVFCTMLQWAGVGNRISLDKLCKALSVKSPKDQISGDKVWDYVKAGGIAEVARYCAADVEATRAVYLRMTYADVAVEQFEDVPA